MKVAAWGKLALPYRKLLLALLVSNVFSVALFGFRIFGSDGLRYWFMLWNLFLAWLPLLFAWVLCQRLIHERWTSPINIGLTLLWLAFLPNSFYVLTDLIHLHRTGEINILFDAVLFSSFIFNGYIMGLLSVYLIHRQLLRRWARLDSHVVIGVIFLLCGYAIYLGRSLRWNSWDALLHPLSLLFDVSEGFVNPLIRPQIVVTTLTFFGLLSVVYAVIYQLAEILRSPLKK